MSKIVIDARELRTSTGRYIERLLNYLQELDQTNNYLVLLKPKDISGWRTKNEHFMAVACPHEEFSFAEQLAFKKQLEDLQPDLVHFGMVQQPVMYKGPVVTTIHDLTTIRFTNPAKNALVFKCKQLIYRQVIKRAASKSAAIITPSQFVKDDLIAFTGVDPGRITVTLEAADPIDSLSSPLQNLQNTEFIMYVGRPTPHKNLERLLAAFALLQAQRPALHLVLAGRTDVNYLRIAELVKTKQIKNVVFTDFVTDGQLRWLYENCAAYVFPSLSEGFGLPGLEAMQHGAPVVSSDATCLPEVYGDAAHYFDPTNTQAMADAINEVLTDTNLRNRLVEAGHLKAQAYSWRRMAEQTLAVYNSVLKS
ncbi:MAG: glycosyltransferase family 1 protein [Patescibacteria group bacterium]|nr:glycosyltransferase family 1 protein [Patescibacteria group bacterium]